VTLAIIAAAVLLIALTPRPRESTSRVLDLTPMIGKRKP
jgi:hypothetical protein